MIQKEETMEYASVLHIPLSQYAFAEAENRLVIRIRIKKGDLTECFLYYADRVCKKTPIEFQEIRMDICAKDEYFDYYEAKVESSYNRICYYFKLIKKEEWTYYYADRFTKSLPDTWIGERVVDGRSEYYQYPFILRKEIPDVPAWFKSAVVYNIFPDSFANGKRNLCIRSKDFFPEEGTSCKTGLGGTIKGITQNLDYIQDMGFTCIYLNPVFTAGEYHKYDVLDYYHIDPCLGSDEEFRELVDKLHERGMKLIIDGVFNHCSWKFFAFEDVVKKGKESRYCDWFYHLVFPVVRPETPEEMPGYTCFAYERKMPKLNTSSEEVQDYFSRVGAYWIREYHVDGWRLDVANEIDKNFWRRFRRAVKKEDPNAVLIGEVWEDAQVWLKGDLFDSVMNYDFRRICKEYLTADCPDAVKAAWQFERMRLRYPTSIVNGQLNLLDSHDVPRFLSLCGGETDLWKLACVLLMLMPGVPSLFYGDEKGIMGVTEEEYRQSMIWEDKENFCGLIKELTGIRKGYMDAEAEYIPLWEYIEDGLFSFCRKNKNRRLAVFVNAGREEKIVDLPNAKILLAEKYEEGYLQSKGYLVCQTD